MFLVDGVDVLFRIAFGILRMNEQELLHCTSVPAVYVALESLPNRMWQPDRLLLVRLSIGITVCYCVLTFVGSLNSTCGVVSRTMKF